MKWHGSCFSVGKPLRHTRTPGPLASEHQARIREVAMQQAKRLDLGLDTGRGQEGALQAFADRLSSRTKVPADRLNEFLGWPERDLARETQAASAVVKRLAQAVVAALDDPASANAFLRDLDLKAISRDHDWRAVFSTLRVQVDGFEDYKSTVMIKYLQYLSFRTRLLEYVCSRRLGLEDTDGHADLTCYPHDDAWKSQARLARQGGVPFERAALGEALEFDLPEGSSIEIVLAAHQVRLVGARPACLVDQNGVTYFLKKGRNTVGRHPESDVVVDGNFGAVSGAHLIIECLEGQRVRIMDLSSKGTFLRREVLEGARGAASTVGNKTAQ